MGKRRGAPDTSHSFSESIALSIDAIMGIGATANEQLENRKGIAGTHLPLLKIIKDFLPTPSELKNLEPDSAKFNYYDTYNENLSALKRKDVYDDETVEKAMKESDEKSQKYLLRLFLLEGTAQALEKDKLIDYLPNHKELFFEIVEKIAKQEKAIYATNIINLFKQNGIEGEKAEVVFDAITKFIDAMDKPKDDSIIAATKALQQVLLDNKEAFPKEIESQNFLKKLAISLYDVDGTFKMPKSDEAATKFMAEEFHKHINQELKNQFRAKAIDLKLEQEHVDKNITSIVTMRGLRNIGNDEAGKETVSNIMRYGFNMSDNNLLKANIQTSLRPETGNSAQKGHTDNGISDTTDMKIAFYFAGGGEDGGWVFLKHQPFGVNVTKYKDPVNYALHSNSSKEEAEIYRVNSAPHEIIGAIHVKPNYHGTPMSTEGNGGLNFNFVIDDAIVNQKFQQQLPFMHADDNVAMLYGIMHGVNKGDITEATVAFKNKFIDPYTRVDIAAQQYDIEIKTNGSSTKLYNQPSLTETGHRALIYRGEHYNHDYYYVEGDREVELRHQGLQGYFVEVTGGIGQGVLRVFDFISLDTPERKFTKMIDEDRQAKNLHGQDAGFEERYLAARKADIKNMLDKGI